MKINVNVKLSASKSLVQLVTILAAALGGSALAQDPQVKAPAIPLIPGNATPEEVASWNEPNPVFEKQPESPAPPAKTRTRTPRVTVPVTKVEEVPATTADEAIAEEEQGVIPTPEEKPETVSAPQEEMLTVVEVRDILSKLMGDDNAKKLKARDILISFGAKSVTEMKPENYAAFVAKAKVELK